MPGIWASRSGNLGQESEHQAKPQRSKGEWDPGQLLSGPELAAAEE